MSECEPRWRIEHAKNIAAMQAMPESSVDAIVTDPPYGLGFMGKEWDTFRPEVVTAEKARDTRSAVRKQLYGEKASGAPSAAMAAGRYDFSVSGNRGFQEGMRRWAVEALRVMKPGSYLLAFGGTRTFHRLTCGLEDAGWEIHDTLSWLYGSGFPKHRSKLKPGWEPIALARRPAPRATALNIDACRIPVDDVAYARNTSGDRGHAGTRTPEEVGATDLRAGGGVAHDAGRWPANVVLDEQAAEQLDLMSGMLTSGANPTRRRSDKFRSTYGAFAGEPECTPARGTDTGGASRFYYCAKASRRERDAGLPDRHNTHPTVKPVALMRWLVRLITPRDGVVLDPFAGSGTTGVAAIAEGCRFIGIEQEEAYAAVARARLEHSETAWRGTAA